MASNQNADSTTPNLTWAEQQTLNIAIRKCKEKAQRREEALKRREENTRKEMCWALKATQAAIAVLCGYSPGRNHLFAENVRFERFAAEVVKGEKEKDMLDFLNVMGSASTATPRSFPVEEIRPLLRVMGELRTDGYYNSYDDTDPGCESGCGHYRDLADSVLNRLTFSDLIKLFLYLTDHSFSHLKVSMCKYGFFADSGLNYSEEQYISALQNAIDIILSAANRTPAQMKDYFEDWFETVKSDVNGWWVEHRFVLYMTDWLDDQMNETMRRICTKAIEEHTKKFVDDFFLERERREKAAVDTDKDTVDEDKDRDDMVD